ncbi:MAG: AMP-binding protein, partial [Acidobacteria bacterium]|nr:AMP-binding protein [Acidobacteriota bacterium]
MNSPGITGKISGWAFHNPGKIAVKSAERIVTYQELENRSNRIAHFMHGKIREIPNVIILLDRSAALIETILGTLKCGLVFVPVDPFLPTNRVKLMIKESCAEWIITNREYYENFKTILDDEHTGLNILFIDDNHQEMATDGKNCFYLATVSLDCVPTFESISNPHCYIYFTSGSTGTPKGILGRSEGLAHFIDWEINEFNVNEHFNVSQLTPPSFDVFLRDIFLPLMAGGTCCIPP